MSGAAACAQQASAWAGAYASAVQLTAQSVINAHSAGTIYALPVGSHNLSLTPKAGDTIIGLGASTVLDGGNSTAQALGDGGSSVPNVILKNIVVQNYAPSYQSAQVGNLQPGSTGWHVINATVGPNATGRGCGGDNGAMSYHGGRFHHNFNLGVGSGSIHIDGTELDHNGNYPQRNNESGGVKWVGNDSTISRAWIHDNIGPGIWSDINATNQSIDNCDVWDNTEEGIQLEISTGTGSVTNSRIRRNGFGGDSGAHGWHWGAGLGIYESGGVDSSHRWDIGFNEFTGNYNEISVIQQTRSDGFPGLCQHLIFHNNTFTAGGNGNHYIGAVSDLQSGQVDWSTRDVIWGTGNVVGPGEVLGNAHGTFFF